MKRQLILAALFAVAALPAAAGPGAPFVTRDPATCPDATQPKSGPPSPAQAARYLACDTEKVSGDLILLISNVKVQVASNGRAYLPYNDSGENVDPHKPVYDIRGSYDHYGCSLKDSLSYTNNPGRHCDVSHQLAARGLCYHDTFGDWHCNMLDPMHFKFDDYHVPPPG